MEQTIGLNAAQMDFLQLLYHGVCPHDIRAASEACM